MKSKDKKNVFTEIDRVIDKLIAIEQLTDEEIEAKLIQEIIASCQEITAKHKSSRSTLKIPPDYL